MRWRGLVGVGLGAGLVAGCGSGRVDDRVYPRESRLGGGVWAGERLVEVERLDVFAGGVLVLPLVGVPSGPVEVGLDDGRVLRSSLHTISVAVPADPSLAGGDVWLPSPGVWGSRDGAGGAGDPWVVRVELPADGQGRSVVMNGERMATNWLPQPGGLARGDGRGEDPWRPARPPKAPAGVAMSPHVYPEAQSPITRWRWRLVRDGLSPGAEVEAFADPVIEALAGQNEDRWRVALGWLWGANADVAERLKLRLAAVVDFGNGVYAPAWATDHAQLDHLLEGLLDPGISPGRRVQIAEQWLREGTSVVAWVIDDGGTLDESRRVLLPTFGLASVLDRSTLAWGVLQVPGGGAQPGAGALRPLGAMSQVASVVAPANAEELARVEASPVAEISVHAGAWAANLPVASRLRGVMPPGLAVGPLWADLSMRDWLEGKASPARGGMVTAGVLQRAPSVVGGGRGWEVFGECVGAGAGRDEVQLFFGPLGRPTAVVRVSASERGVRRAGGWSFRVELPAEAIEPDGIVRIGVVRVDEQGRRSAWPRPMLPWQEEPGRAALNLRAWGGRE